VKVAVLLNARRCGDGADQLGDTLRTAGLEVELVACEPARLTETARRLAPGVDAVIAAGGDGTVSAVAAGLVGGQVPLAVLPLGTLNHFARDLGMPLELPAAARAIATGRVAQIDVGEVNGRVFVNNSSIGLYPEMVRIRDRDQRATGRGKWPAMVLAALRVLRRFRLHAVRVEMPHRVVSAVTPFVFVGNNDYSTSVSSLGQRPTLAGGRLSLYVIRTRGRLHTLLVLARAMLGRAEAVHELDTELVTELWVSPRARRVRVALDGEVTTMTAPLHYRIRPGALAVVMPPAADVARSDEPRMMRV
jgi:diacylglycerol kinase family enzyme